MTDHGNKDCFQYNPRTNSWSIFLTANTAHLYSSGTLYNHDMYIFDTVTGNSETFDMLTKSQIGTIATPFSTGNGACTVQIRDSVFVIGGKSFRSRCF